MLIEVAFWPISLFFTSLCHASSSCTFFFRPFEKIPSSHFFLVFLSRVLANKTTLVY